MNRECTASRERTGNRLSTPTSATRYYYVSVCTRTSKEYKYISNRRDSTPLRLPNIWLSQPLPACSVRWAGTVVKYTYILTERGEVGRVKCVEDEWGCCPVYHWYITFAYTPCTLRKVLLIKSVRGVCVRNLSMSLYLATGWRGCLTYISKILP